jgi:MFS family permease
MNATGARVIDTTGSRAVAIWRDPQFVKIWAAGIVSALGSSITTLAVPLIAVDSLEAGPIDMGRLGAAGTASFLVFGLLAGVIVDRAPRRLVLVTTTMTSAIVVGTIPILAATGALRMWHLYAIAFAAGSLTVVHEVAMQSILPRLIGRERLLTGNSTIRTTGAITDVAGPSMAGVLVQLLTAPVAILFDALSFVIAGVLTFLIRVQEPTSRRRWTEIGSEIQQGLRYVFHAPALRAIALGGGIHNVFSNGAIVALYVLYATQVIGLSPIQLGLVYGSVGPGALVGSVVAARYSSRFGVRRTLVHMQVITGLARWLVPLAAFAPAPLAILAIGEFTMGIVRSIFNINQVSLRQTMTPDDLQGRMNASIRFFMWVFVPLGSLAGGFAASHVGLTATLAIAATGTTLAAICFLLVPARVDAIGYSSEREGHSAETL